MTPSTPSLTVIRLLLLSLCTGEQLLLHVLLVPSCQTCQKPSPGDSCQTMSIYYWILGRFMEHHSNLTGTCFYLLDCRRSLMVGLPIALIGCFHICHLSQSSLVLCFSHVGYSAPARLGYAVLKVLVTTTLRLVTVRVEVKTARSTWSSRSSAPCSMCVCEVRVTRPRVNSKYFISLLLLSTEKHYRVAKLPSFTRCFLVLQRDDWKWIPPESKWGVFLIDDMTVVVSRTEWRKDVVNNRALTIVTAERDKMSLNTVDHSVIKDPSLTSRKNHNLVALTKSVNQAVPRNYN